MEANPMPTFPEDLRSRYGDRWKIRQDEVLRVWTAERRDGTAVRYIVGLTARELAGRLRAAEQAKS
jgi:hypothetical protein